MVTFMLGEQEHVFKPMSWERQKQAMDMLVEALVAQDQLKSFIGSVVQSYLKGDEGSVDLKLVVGLVRKFPDLATKMLAFGLEIDEAALNAGSGKQFWAALELWLEQNDIVDQLEQAKKVYALFRPAPKKTV